ncbi:MAG: hypothetical protein NTW48_00025 [Chloroflexi bacterium]|nr:hypothetical protein [Chloroflexota bacterium]
MKAAKIFTAVLIAAAILDGRLRSPASTCPQPADCPTPSWLWLLPISQPRSALPQTSCLIPCPWA